MSDWSKLKAFVNDNLNATLVLKFFSGRIGSIERKGEIDGYQHFLLFSQAFQKDSKSGSFDCVIKG